MRLLLPRVVAVGLLCWVGILQRGICQSTTKDAQADPPVAIEFALPLGNTVSEFTYSKSGTILYKGKKFNPAVTSRPDDVPTFRISLLKERGLAGAIAEDVDGQNRLFLLDLKTSVSTPLQPPGMSSAAQRVFWSPSGRYMLALCTYEGQRFVGVELKSKKVSEGDFLAANGRLWAIKGDPHWDAADSLLFTVEETCNPYDEPDCDVERVLATYLVRLDAATLTFTTKNLP